MLGPPAAMQLDPEVQSPSSVQSREHFFAVRLQYPKKQSASLLQAAPTAPAPSAGRHRPMRLEALTEPSALHRNPDGQPPPYRHESTHASPATPSVVTGDEQFTDGGLGMVKALKSMCCPSPHTFTT